MASTTPNMSLTKWDDLNDYFSHAQLAANFQAIDEHDHTSGRGAQIPAGGLAPLSVSAANLQEGVFTVEKIADGSITNDKIADATIAAGKIAVGAAIPDSKLASPNNASWVDVWEKAVIFTDAHTTGTYLLTDGTPLLAATNGSAAAVKYLDPADRTAGSLTNQYRVRITLLANATAPGTITYTGALYPISAVAGAADSVTVTAGAAAHTAAITNPTASTRHNNVSATATADTAGYYALGVAISANVASDSRVAVNVTLQSNRA